MIPQSPFFCKHFTLFISVILKEFYAKLKAKTKHKTKTAVF